jgi:hypothetical protein
MAGDGPLKSQKHFSPKLKYQLKINTTPPPLPKTLQNDTIQLSSTTSVT